MKKELIERIACPVCFGKVEFFTPHQTEHLQQAEEILCSRCQLVYPIQEGIPVMLQTEARALNDKSPEQVTAAQDEVK